jgi:aminotransferase
VVSELKRVGSREVEDWVELRRENGAEVLTLRGGPVLSLPVHIREAALAAFDEADRRPSRGLPELCQAIAEALAAETGVPMEAASQVLITNGAMHGLNLVMRALIDSGDEVIVPTPNYFFDGVIRLAGGVPVHVPSSEATGWAWDLDRIEASIGPRTRLFVASNPTNPTGYLPTRSDLARLVQLAERHGFVVLSDESYDRFVYDGAAFNSLAAFDSQATVVVRSLSKSHALASWRIGYVVAPPDLSEAFTKVLEWDCLHCAYLTQRVALAAVTGPQGWLAGIPSRYQNNRDRLLAAVAESGWLSATRPAAAPFLFLDTSRAESATGRSCSRLLLELGVPTVPGEFFQSPGHARLPIGADEETLERLGELLASFRPR